MVAYKLLLRNKEGQLQSPIKSLPLGLIYPTDRIVYPRPHTKIFCFSSHSTALSYIKALSDTVPSCEEIWKVEIPDDSIMSTNYSVMPTNYSVMVDWNYNEDYTEYIKVEPYLMGVWQDTILADHVQLIERVS